MRSILLVIVAVIIANNALSQAPSCDALPIGYDPLGITFADADMSFGDSVIIIPMTNTSSVNMAYPQLKLVPLTPLPPGMTQNTHWDTFASSWNPGVTMPANCFFDVALPIPLDFTVMFEPWAYNLTPLLEDDSCVFDVPFNINLNPSATGIAHPDGSQGLRIWPVPAVDRLHVALPAGLSRARLVIVSTTGAELRNYMLEASSSEADIDLMGLVSGIYVLALFADNGTILHQRFTITH